MNWEIVTQLSVLVAGLAAGGTFTVPAIRRLKGLLKTNGWQTNVLVGVFAVVITLALAVVESQIAPGTISPDSWGILALAMIGQAEARYRQLKDDLE